MCFLLLGLQLSKNVSIHFLSYSRSGLITVSPVGPAVSGAFQEMKAEVSEVPAPPKVQENVQDNAGLTASALYHC